MRKSLLFTLLWVLSITIANAQPTGVTATEIGARSATLEWTAAGSETSWNLRYLDSSSTEGVSFYEDFEQGIGDGWMVYDYDGDGYTWYSAEGVCANESNGLFSPSYHSSIGSMDADNWLITPMVDLTGTLSFWAGSYSSSYPDDFMVMLYVGDITEVSIEDVEANAIELLPLTTAPGEGKVYEIDLSEYEGQQGSIIFRHKCYDMWYFLLDDVMITSSDAWVTIPNVTNPYTLTGLTPLTSYAVQVQAAEGGAWSETYTFVTIDPTPAPTDVYADNVTISSADIYWDADETATGFNVKYRVSPEGEGFEEGLNGWTAVDADGDGYNWQLGTEVGRMTNHSGSDCIVSASYDNDTSTALTPDNWLISPQVTLGGELSFWVMGQDDSYCEEVFRVYVSTTGTDIENFEPVTDDLVATDEYRQIVVDLSDYSGQGYVAIRHYNITDMFFLNIDDIVITVPGENTWTTLTTTEPQASLEDLEMLTSYDVAVQAVYDEGLSPWASASFTTTGELVAFKDDVDNVNASLIGSQDGHDIPSFTIDGLTFTNDGKYHVISLPFDLDAEALAASPLAGATLKEISSYTEEDGVFKVFFSDATEIVANHVYFYKWTGAPLSNPKFENVTIDLDRAFYWTFYDEEQITAATGTYYNILMGNEYYFAFDDENQYFFLTDSTNGTSIKAFDGIFQFETDLEEADAIFEDEFVIPTGISEVTTKSNGTWFNAQGVKLNAKPAQKGVYVNNGKKFVVK